MLNEKEHSSFFEYNEVFNTQNSIDNNVSYYYINLNEDINFKYNKEFRANIDENIFLDIFGYSELVTILSNHYNIKDNKLPSRYTCIYEQVNGITININKFISLLNEKLNLKFYTKKFSNNALYLVIEDVNKEIMVLKIILDKIKKNKNFKNNNEYIGNLSFLFINPNNTNHINIYNDIIEIHSMCNHKNNKRINLIVTDINNNISTISQEIEDVEDLDLDLLYESDEKGVPFSFYSDKILKDVNTQNKSSLYIFDGEPGTGKTTYIRYLINNSPDIDFYVLPQAISSIIFEPSFMTFLSQKLSNSVLIMEDVEQVLTSRDVNNNNSVGGILNISDGLFSDFLKIKMIFTLNNVNNIDKALLRPGRLTMRKTFTSLSDEKIKKICEKYGIEYSKDKNTLAKIFNDNNDYENDKKVSVGFK